MVEMIRRRVVEHIDELYNYRYWDDLVECEGYSWEELEAYLGNVLPTIATAVVNLDLPA